MIDRLIHGCFDVNRDIVWDNVLKDEPPHVADLEKIIHRETAINPSLIFFRSPIIEGLEIFNDDIYH